MVGAERVLFTLLDVFLFKTYRSPRAKICGVVSCNTAKSKGASSTSTVRGTVGAYSRTNKKAILIPSKRAFLYKPFGLTSCMRLRLTPGSHLLTGPSRDVCARDTFNTGQKRNVV